MGIDFSYPMFLCKVLVERKMSALVAVVVAAPEPALVCPALSSAGCGSPVDLGTRRRPLDARPYDPPCDRTNTCG